MLVRGQWIRGRREEGRRGRRRRARDDDTLGVRVVTRVRETGDRETDTLPPLSTGGEPDTRTIGAV